MIEVRQAENADLPQLVKLEQESFHLPWSYGSLAGELAGRGLWPKLHVLTIDGVIAAYTASNLVLDELQLYRIATAKEFRRRGLARRLLLEVWAEAQAKGASICTLEVRESNEGARKFYERLGFREVGRRKHYYSDTGEAAILLDWQ